MKKKIVSFAAVLMAMAMTTTSAFAVTPRESGDVDASGTLTAGDAVQVLNSANQGTEIANGDFDGAWSSTDNKVTAADAQRIMDYVLQPEKKFDEIVNLRIYSEAGKGEGTVTNLISDIELDNTKAYDNTYTDKNSQVAAVSNDTLLDVLKTAKNLAVSKPKAIDTLATNINKVYFTSANKGDVYLTSEDGWAVLAYALKAINPVSPENCGLINKPVDEKYATMDATTKARVDAFEEMGKIITKNGDGQLTLTADEVEQLYALALKAFPGNGEITEEQYAQAADDTYAIYSSKYGVSMETEKLGSFAVGQSTDPNFSTLVDLLRNYDTKTIQDVRNALGDKISVTTGANTVVAELYAAAVAK